MIKIKEVDPSRFVPSYYQRDQKPDVCLYVASRKYGIKPIDLAKLAISRKSEKYSENLIVAVKMTDAVYVATSPLIAEQLRSKGNLSAVFGIEGNVTIEELSDEEYQILRDVLKEKTSEEVARATKEPKEAEISAEAVRKSPKGSAKGSISGNAVYLSLKAHIEGVKAKTLCHLLDRFNQNIHEQKRRAEEKKKAHHEKQSLILQEEIGKKELKQETLKHEIMKKTGVKK